MVLFSSLKCVYVSTMSTTIHTHTPRPPRILLSTQTSFHFPLAFSHFSYYYVFLETSDTADYLLPLEILLFEFYGILGIPKFTSYTSVSWTTYDSFIDSCSSSYSQNISQGLFFALVFSYFILLRELSLS